MLDTASSSKRFVLRFMVVLGLAVTGQLLLDRAGESLFLWAGAGFYAVSVFFLSRFSTDEYFQPSPPFKKRSFKIEAVSFLLILGLGIFLRAYGANRLPEGIFVDRAEVACGALRILHDHWRPFVEALSFHVPELPIYYMVAGWFKFFGSTPEVYAYFDVFLSTAGIALMYVFFRQLTDPVPSLLAFFLLAVMRWNFFFAHQDYFQSQTVLFMALTLASLLYALRRHKPVFAAVAGLALAAGLYSYQSLKALPLLAAVILLFEFFGERNRFKKNKEVWTVFGIVFVLAAMPYLAWVLQNGHLGRREMEVSVFGDIEAHQSLLPLWQNIRDMVLIFNHSDADWSNQFYFQHHRILDDGMGVLLILGFFHCLTRVRERNYFIVLAGLAVMCLPGVFSNRGGTSWGRMLGMTPFVACVCAFFLIDLWSRWQSCQPAARLKLIVLIVFFALLAAIGFENYYTYFCVQARIPQYNNDCSWSESRVGRYIKALPMGTESFLPSLYYGHPTVKYLTYPNWDRIHPLDLAHPPQPHFYPSGADFCFILDEFKEGAVDFLKTLYPGGEFETIRGPLGDTSLYVYWVPSAALEGFKNGPTAKRGLEGFYRHSPDEKEAPFLKNWDPVLNFNFRDLPMTGTPLFIHWTGEFKAYRKGFYRIGAMLFASSQGRIVVDRKGKMDLTNQPYWEGELKQGWHYFDFYYQDPGTQVTQINLIWKPPGQNQFMFMPNAVFGKIH